MQCFVLYYSKAGTNTEEMNHVVSFMMLYLVCGHIVIKKTIAVYSMYTLFRNTHLLSELQRGLIPTQRQEQLSENVLSKPVSCNLNGVVGSHALYSFFVSFTLLFKINLFHIDVTLSQVWSNKLLSLHHTLNLNSKTSKGRDSAVMYISNRAYLSTT